MSEALSPYVSSSEIVKFMPFVDFDEPDAVLPEKVEIDVSVLSRIVATLVKVENMEGDTFRAMNLGNATPEFMVDELKVVRDQIKPRQTYEKLLSGILKDNHNPPSHKIQTDRNLAEFQWITKRILDKDKVIQYQEGKLEVDSFDDLCKDSNYWQIKIKALAV